LENRKAVATSEKKTCFDAGKIGFCHCEEDGQKKKRGKKQEKL